MMKWALVLIIAGMAGFAGAAFADPIEGTWKRPSTGSLVTFSKCGADFCGVAISGPHSGKSFAKMSGSDGNYSGTMTDLAENKTYKGKAVLNGNLLKLSGCVMFGLVCKGENWERQ